MFTSQNTTTEDCSMVSIKEHTSRDVSIGIRNSLIINRIILYLHISFTVRNYGAGIILKTVQIYGTEAERQATKVLVPYEPKCSKAETVNYTR
jgi:hypothetical protein